LNSALSSTSILTEQSPSTFHRELKNIYCKCHNHRRLYRRTTIRWHFIESWKIFTANATITDDFTDGQPSVGISQRVEKYLLQMPHSHRWIYRRTSIHRDLSTVHNHRQNHWQTVWILKGRVLNASLTMCSCRWNYRRTVKI